MKRKVIQIANSTQLVSLPRKWAIEQGIEKGDELEITEQGNILTIQADTSHVPEKIEVDISKMDVGINKILHAAYKKGADEIVIKYVKPEQLAIVQQMIAKAVVGFEITSQEKDTCIIKAVAEAYEGEFDTILRRTFLITKSMIQGIIDVMDSKDISRIDNVRYLEEVNNKYTGFLRRIINKGSHHKHSKESHFLYALIEDLEKMGDHLKFVCDHIKTKGAIKTIDKGMIDRYRNFEKMFNDLYELYYSYDQARAIELYRNRKKMYEEYSVLLTDGKNTVITHHLINCLQKLAELLTFVIELNL